jgi:hypothetical protein
LVISVAMAASCGVSFAGESQPARNPTRRTAAIPNHGIASAYASEKIGVMKTSFD